MNKGTVYLIPAELAEGVTEAIPAYVLDGIKQCSVFFVENERTTRRYFKRLWPQMVIDNYQWVVIHKAEAAVLNQFGQCLQQGKTVGIVSEAGCPGVADPGQVLVAKAQQKGAMVKPLVGPNSILLALMASGLNGQSFKFTGYLPVDKMERKKAIKVLEDEALAQNTTQIFIETPYRNNPLLKDILDSCSNETMLCIAKNITAPNEQIVTKSIKEWKGGGLEIHKIPVIFLLGKGN